MDKDKRCLLIYNVPANEQKIIYNKGYTIHTYEADARCLAQPVSRLSFLQGSAGNYAGRLGLSLVELFNRNMILVLSRYHAIIHRYPALGVPLEVMTWPSCHHGNFALRDFEVFDGARGHLLCRSPLRRRGPAHALADSVGRRPAHIPPLDTQRGTGRGARLAQDPMDTSKEIREMS